MSGSLHTPQLSRVAEPDRVSDLINAWVTRDGLSVGELTQGERYVLHLEVAFQPEELFGRTTRGSPIRYCWVASSTTAILSSDDAQVAVRTEDVGGRFVGVARFHLPIPAETEGVVRRLQVMPTADAASMSIEFLVLGSTDGGPSSPPRTEPLYQFSLDLPISSPSTDRFAGVILPGV